MLVCVCPMRGKAKLTRPLSMFLPWKCEIHGRTNEQFNQMNCNWMHLKCHYFFSLAFVYFVIRLSTRAKKYQKKNACSFPICLHLFMHVLVHTSTHPHIHTTTIKLRLLCDTHTTCIKRKKKNFFWLQIWQMSSKKKRNKNTHFKLYFDFNFFPINCFLTFVIWNEL